MTEKASLTPPTARWTRADLASFQELGFVSLPQVIAPEEVCLLQSWVDELAGWPEEPGRWMKWFEHAEGERTLCRMEDFLPYHPGLRDWALSTELTALVSELMGEDATLFKEKINFKLPGGGAYAPHQDAPAFAVYGHQFHITAMVAVDPSTSENGTLEMGPPCLPGELLPQRDDGTLAEVDDDPWCQVELAPGDVLFFHSYVPHRSPPNRSEGARRAMFMTWNRRAEGQVRERYFADKRRAFPPECERREGVDYGAAAAVFNLGNPIQ